MNDDVCVQNIYEISDDEYVAASREVVQGQAQGHGHGKLPVYQLHYAVYYNASAEAAPDDSFAVFQTSTIVPDAGAGDQKASNVCARHYAESFLIRLFMLDSWLNELCVTQRPFRPRVVIHTVVVVRVYGSLVSIRHSLFMLSKCGLMPSTHRRRRRDETVELRRVGVGGVYMNSQLVHDDCRRIRRCERSRRP